MLLPTKMVNPAQHTATTTGTVVHVHRTN